MEATKTGIKGSGVCKNIHYFYTYNFFEHYNKRLGIK